MTTKTKYNLVWHLPCCRIDSANHRVRLVVRGDSTGFYYEAYCDDCWVNQVEKELSRGE